PAQRSGEDFVLGSRRLGNLVQAIGDGNVSVPVCRDRAERDRRLGVGRAAGRDRFEPRTTAKALRAARGDEEGRERKGKPGTVTPPQQVFFFLVENAFFP